MSISRGQPCQPQKPDPQNRLHAPVITFVATFLDSPPNVSLTKYRPSANPSAFSTCDTQYSARSPTAPRLIPLSTSSRARTAFHASVSSPRYGAYARPARVTKYASSTSRSVSFRMAEREGRYVVEVRMIVEGKLRGAKVEKYVEKSNSGRESLTFLNDTGL